MLHLCMDINLFSTCSRFGHSAISFHYSTKTGEAHPEFTLVKGIAETRTMRSPCSIQLLLSIGCCVLLNQALGPIRIGLVELLCDCVAGYWPGNIQNLMMTIDHTASEASTITSPTHTQTNSHRRINM